MKRTKIQVEWEVNIKMTVEERWNFLVKQKECGYYQNIFAHIIVIFVENKSWSFGIRKKCLTREKKELSDSKRL